MALPPPPTVRDVDIVIPLFMSLALLMSSYRLWYRAHMHQFGWDDWVCALAACLLVIQLVASMLYLNGPVLVGQQGLIILYYIMTMDYQGILYTVRISLTLTLIRIVPSDCHRRWLYRLIGIFVFAPVLLYSEDLWICEHDTAWKELPSPMCSLGMGHFFTEVILDVSSDIILVTLPIYLFLYQTKLERSDRLRLVLTFSSSLLLTVAATAQDAMVIVSENIGGMFAWLLANAIAVMVCNSAVIGSAIHRLAKGVNEQDQSAIGKDVGTTRTSSTSGPLSAQLWIHSELSRCAEPSLSLNPSFARRAAGVPVIQIDLTAAKSFSEKPLPPIPRGSSVYVLPFWYDVEAAQPELYTLGWST